MHTLESIINSITPVSQESTDKAREKLEQLAMPSWALGDLMDCSLKLASIYNTTSPNTSKKCTVVMAADHGIYDEGFHSFPQAVTQAMVKTMLAGGAGINAISKQAGSELYIADMGIKADMNTDYCEQFENLSVAKGSQNFVQEKAMSREQAEQSIIRGYEYGLKLCKSYDVFAIGEMGIANTASSSALISVLCKESVSICTGRGTGIDDQALQKKIHCIETALKHHQPNEQDVIDCLSKVGGFEIGGMAGFMLACASSNKAIILDGLISTAAALIAYGLNPKVTDYMFAGHQSVEPGHHYALKKLGLIPLLDLNLRLGEATGATLAFNLLDAASNLLTDVMSLDRALEFMPKPS